MMPDSSAFAEASKSIQDAGLLVSKDFPSIIMGSERMGDCRLEQGQQHLAEAGAKLDVLAKHASLIPGEVVASLLAEARALVAASMRAFEDESAEFTRRAEPYRYSGVATHTRLTSHASSLDAIIWRQGYALRILDGVTRQAAPGSVA